MVRAARARGLHAAGGLPLLAHAIDAASAVRDGTGPLALRPDRRRPMRPQTLAEQRRALPDEPGVYLFRDARGRVIYVGKAKSIRKRVASHFSKAQVRGHTPGHAEMVAAVEHDRVRRRRQRGRGAAGRAELHQAVPAALQHPPARRQVLPVHRHLARRGLPARLLHARAPPPRARLLRPLLQRQARARDARPAGEGLHVPLVHRRRAGAAQRQPVPGLLHQALRGALRRLRLAGGATAQASTA